MKLHVLPLVLSSALLLTAAIPTFAADEPWAPFIEPNFPFFSSSLDLRPQNPNAVPMNVTPRGLVLNLGHECWACFDTDLLRLAAVWEGPKCVSEEALAQISYQNGNVKTIGGQSKLPKPQGPVWMINGIYPGWQIGEKLSLEDARPPQPSKEEPGRGPIPPAEGQFKAVRLSGQEAVLEYTIAGTLVQEWVTATRRDDARTVQRNFRVAPCTRPVTLVLGLKAGSPQARFTLSEDPAHRAVLMEDQETWSVRVPAHSMALDFSVAIGTGASAPVLVPAHPPTPGQPSAARWPEEITTHALLSTAKDPYVVDDVPLPLKNSWRRNVRLADIQFFKDGKTAAGVTVDGDVWIIHGLRENLGDVHWKRFASGLHEPMGIAIRDGQLYVFDRNGIWRLRDTNGDGEADVHELFSNVFPQSAESREFPNTLKLAPDGSFVIAKGGQQATTISALNGSVLRVSPDGQSFSVLGYGFRQPFAGVNPRTGMVTASDQEGHYTPTTPLHILRQNEYHGFLSELLPKEKYPAPIADPLTWIPHQINPSAASQVWLFDAHMGPLNDNLVHVGFNRPELFRVLLNERSSRPQAAVVSIIRDFDVPSLNASVNPADGSLYVTGFQVIGWGTTAKRISGLARVRYTGATCPLPREVVPMDKGVLLRFDVPLDPQKAADPVSYSLESWHYKRTWNYGSPHFKADGTPGQDWITASSAYLAKDGKAVFVGVPGMKPVEQMRIGWSLATPEGAKVEDNAYFSPYELPAFDSVAEGFGTISVDLTPRAAIARTSVPATVEEGRRLYQLMGCMACHATDDSVQPKIGPSWKGLFGKEREISKGPKVIADEAYIRESILTPSAKIVKGYEKVEAGMPVYSGVLTDSQIESLILFIKSLK